MSALMTQAAFARHIGMSKGHVSNLKKAGRLVMSEDGKRVVVDASLERIEQTNDPNRDDVRQRHAAEREERVGSESPGSGLVCREELRQTSPDPSGVSVKQAEAYQVARARKEVALADLAEVNRDIELGKLVAAADVTKSGIELGTFIRTKLENLPDQLAPELAPISDPARVNALLVEHFESLLTDMSRQLAALVEVKT